MMTPSDVVGRLQWRYATKQFDRSRTIDSGTWSLLEDCLVLAPSSFGLQPWKFVVITDQATKDALVPLSWNQSQIADASHGVVFLVKNPVTVDDVRRFILRTAEVRGVGIESLAGYESMLAGFIEKPPYPLDLREWAARQVYIAFGTLMTAAAMMGVDTCPMEGIDPAGYDKVLGLEGSGYETLAACPVGYRLETDKYATLPKVRFAKDELIRRITS